MLPEPEIEEATPVSQVQYLRHRSVSQHMSRQLVILRFNDELSKL